MGLADTAKDRARAARAWATRGWEAARPRPRIEVAGRSLLASPRSDRHNDADYDDGWNLVLLSRGGPFLDIGSFIGMNSLVALALDPDREVVLVDASHESLGEAASMMLANGFGLNLTFVQAFVDAEDDTEVEFYSGLGGQAGSKYSSHVPGSFGPSRTLRTLTIDTICARTGLRPTLVKMDIEGAEVDAIRGATELAKAQEACFQIEVHALPDRPMPETLDPILAWCREVGYDAWLLKDGEPLTSSDRVARRGRCHVLLQPHGRPYPEELVGMRQGTSYDEAWAQLQQRRRAPAS